MSSITKIFTLTLLFCSDEYGNALTTTLSTRTPTTTTQQKIPTATSGRRNFLQTAVTLGSAAVVGMNPLAANAEYGRDAKMSFPDVVGGMADRASKQCLVESLGNRECLVYMEDAEKFLYKGADVNTLLSRIKASTDALDQIPALVEDKKWNAVTGILTGPMGQLSSTLTMVTGLASDPKVSKDKAQIVKQDLFAMGTATTNKKGDDVLKYQKKAIEDLATFLKSL